MFPLSAVLFPHASMPLHVFEPRYRELMRDCLAGDGRFGIVLIERGSEVGGDDERSLLGTRGVITRGGRAARRALGPGDQGGGADRVEEWLPDDPYPVALVREASAGGGRLGPTPPRWWSPPANGSAGPGPCWRSRVARRHWRPTSHSTGEAMSIWPPGSSARRRR